MSSGLSMASSSRGAEKTSLRDSEKMTNTSSRANNILGGGFSPRNIASLFGSMVVLERYFSLFVEFLPFSAFRLED